jgi:CHASE2 domain-containing sensor protein
MRTLKKMVEVVAATGAWMLALTGIAVVGGLILLLVVEWPPLTIAAVALLFMSAEGGNR